MPEFTQEILKTINDTHIRTSFLEKDVKLSEKQCEKVSQKISESLEKLKEMNVNVMKMLSIHEEKHQQHEKIEEELKEEVKELHSRITTVNRDLHDRMNLVECNISKKIDSLREEIQRENKEDQTENNDSKKVSQFISDFNKYKWVLMGIILTLGFILGHADVISKVFSIFK